VSYYPTQATVEPVELLGFSTTATPGAAPAERATGFDGGALYFSAPGGDARKDKSEPPTTSCAEDAAPRCAKAGQQDAPRVVLLRHEGATMRLTLQPTWFDRPATDLLGAFAKWYRKTKGTPLAGAPALRSVAPDARVRDLPDGATLSVVVVRAGDAA